MGAEMRVPQSWTNLLTQVRKAQVARSVYRSAGASQQARDAAIIDYSNALDAIFAALDRMMDSGLLTTISVKLSKRGGF
jgi:uncharacterized protein (DUF2267 family)